MSQRTRPLWHTVGSRAEQKDNLLDPSLSQQEHGHLEFDTLWSTAKTSEDERSCGLLAMAAGQIFCHSKLADNVGIDNAFATLWGTATRLEPEDQYSYIRSK